MQLIHSLHMLCDSFKPASLGRCLTKYLRLNTHEFSSAHRLGLNTHRSSHLDKLKIKYLELEFHLINQENKLVTVRDFYQLHGCCITNDSPIVSLSIKSFKQSWDSFSHSPY